MMTHCVIAPGDSPSLISSVINMTIKSVFTHINGASDTQRLNNNLIKLQSYIRVAKIFVCILLTSLITSSSHTDFKDFT